MAVNVQAARSWGRRTCPDPCVFASVEWLLHYISSINHMLVEVASGTRCSCLMWEPWQPQVALVDSLLRRPWIRYRTDTFFLEFTP